MSDLTKYPRYFIFLFFFIVSLPVKAEILDSLLKELDKTIEMADIYVQQREVRICQLKEMLKSNKISLEERFKLNTQLYQEYKAYVCDSAMQYLSININLAESSGDKFRKDQNMLHLSLLLSSLGMYTEAIDVLSSVDRNTISNDLLIDYYSCINSIYGELGIYTKDKKLSNRYWIIAQNYKDSLSIVLYCCPIKSI